MPQALPVEKSACGRKEAFDAREGHPRGGLTTKFSLATGPGFTLMSWTNKLLVRADAEDIR